MEIEVKPNVSIDDGKHTGIITGVEYRTTPYAYTDVVIETQGIKLKVGYPTMLMEESKLGQLLKRLNVVFVVGQKVNIDKEIIGKNVEFITMKKGKYANIIPDSVKENIEKVK